ncbi:MAG TPA: GNAT family N-acetyltransferase [Solirubrobacterales bacterium]|nr:GNAT family N-acetyltransferase [Solirubrobacterales bacterium]
MEGAATSDRDELLAFELALDEQVCDEVRRESWGRLFLTPSTPLIWDASWAGIEQTGLGIKQVIEIAEEALGGAGFAHRTVCALDQADGRRLAEELEADPARWPGWEVERTRYMVWHGGKPRSPPRRSQFAPDSGQKCERHRGVGVREMGLEEIEGLRRALLAEAAVPSGVAEPQAVVDQLLELDRRYGEAGGDRWFVAPADDEPLAACRLLCDGRIAQVEDVGTRASARERGYAKAIALAGVAAARAAGDAPIFLTADAADWPQLLYAKLGFEAVGDLTILRRRP